MIVARLYGGLGNQIFQYATARRLADNIGTELVLDIGDLGKDVANITARNYELWRYPIRARTLSLKEVKAAKLYTNKILKRLPLPRPWSLYRENHFHFDSKILKLKNDVYLDGYWQCPKYFESIADDLEKELTPTQPMGNADRDLSETINGRNSVSIHVRRGDYVSVQCVAQTHGICSLDYYRNAVELMIKRVDDPIFFVFSDDPDWVRENLVINAPTEYVSHNGPDTAFQDMRLMSFCKHQIIANSSFSWWGAWLNSNPNKIVIAPKIWFLDARDTSDIIPENWIRI
jgi:hypothetical protein